MNTLHAELETICCFYISLEDLNEMFLQSAENLDVPPSPVMIAAMSLASKPTANTLPI